jgi:hypothetical protein
MAAESVGVMASRRSAGLSPTETRASRLSAVEHAHISDGQECSPNSARGQRSPRSPGPVSNLAHASPDSDDAASSPRNIGLPSDRSQSAMFLRRCSSVNALTALFAMPESGDFLLGTQPGNWSLRLSVVGGSSSTGAMRRSIRRGAVMDDVTRCVEHVQWDGQQRVQQHERRHQPVGAHGGAVRASRLIGRNAGTRQLRHDPEGPPLRPPCLRRIRRNL